MATVLHKANGNSRGDLDTLPILQRSQRTSDEAAAPTAFSPGQVLHGPTIASIGAAELATEYQHEIGSADGNYSGDTGPATLQFETGKVRHHRSAEPLRQPYPVVNFSDRDESMVEPISQSGVSQQDRTMRRYKSGSLRIALRKMFSRHAEASSSSQEEPVPVPPIPACHSQSQEDIVKSQSPTGQSIEIPHDFSPQMVTLESSPVAGPSSTAQFETPALLPLSLPESILSRPKLGLRSHPDDSAALSLATQVPQDYPMSESSPEEPYYGMTTVSIPYTQQYSQDKARRLMGIEGTASEPSRGKKRKQGAENLVPALSPINDSMVTAPRKTMEVNSILARLTELEGRMTEIEYTQRRITLYEHRATAAFQESQGRSDRSCASGPYHTPPASQHGSPPQHKAGVYKPNSHPSSPQAVTPPTPSLTPALPTGPQSRRTATASLPKSKTPPMYNHRSTTSLPNPLLRPLDIHSNTTPTSPNSASNIHFFLSSLAGEKSARQALEADVLLLRREVDALRGHLTPYPIPVSIHPQPPTPVYASVHQPHQHSRSTTQDSTITLSHPRPLRRVTGHRIAGHATSTSTTTPHGFGASAASDGGSDRLGSRFSISSRGHSSAEDAAGDSSSSSSDEDDDNNDFDDDDDDDAADLYKDADETSGLASMLPPLPLPPPPALRSPIDVLGRSRSMPPGAGATAAAGAAAGGAQEPLPRDATVAERTRWLLGGGGGPG